MPKVSDDQLREAIAAVEDPLLGTELGRTRSIKEIESGRRSVKILIELPIYRYPEQETLQQRIADAITGTGEERRVEVGFTPKVKAVGGVPGKGSIPGVSNAIAVASGKGGVGKSTVASNLAIALAQDGAKVGLMDADVYGPSVPMMLGSNARPGMQDDKIIPPQAFGIKLMSIGFLMPSDKALIWRGPLVAQLINQFLGDVNWGQLDYLIIDMPPGTGDAHLSLVQAIQLAGAVITTTPQDVAIADAIKGIRMFEEVKAPILGIVENMSYFVCPNCGETYDIFGTGGGERTAREFGVELLGQIPIDPSIREAGDIGHPVVAAHPDSAPAEAFRQTALNVAIGVARAASKRPHRPTIQLMQTN
ncbi:MAG: Mrp/NBP35 family ATP-binding protein [Thermomicrobiales bacterium]